MSGCLGIGSQHQRNTSLQMELLWRFSQEENALWRVVKVIYRLDHHGWITSMPKNKGKQRRWSGILKCKEHFVNFVEFAVQNGRRIKLWEDNWCGTVTLAQKYLDNYGISNKKRCFHF